MPLLVIKITRGCGGLGDRIVGLVSAIVLARYLKRSLKIWWESPDVRSVLVIPKHLQIQKLPSSKTKMFNCIDARTKFEKEFLDPHLLARLADHHIVLACNQNIAEYIYRNEGITTGPYEKEMREVYQSIFTNYLIPSVPTTLEPGAYLGVQVRTGDASMIETSRHVIVTNLAELLKSVVQKIVETPSLRTYDTIYFTSDHPTAHELFQKLCQQMKHGARIKTTRRCAKHFEKSDGTLSPVMEDMNNLIHANALIISTYSNYGRIAALANTTNCIYGFGRNSIHIDQIFCKTLLTKPVPRPPILKIFGERNSGTSYLTALLRKNFEEKTVVHTVISKNRKGATLRHWKHGHPADSLYREYGPNTIVIFVVREVVSWLRSMYKNPYELRKLNSFKKFIAAKQVPDTIQIDADTGRAVSDSDKDKTIFDIRYQKLESYFQFLAKHQNCVLVSLHYLQSHTADFLEQLESRFQLKRLQPGWITCLPHTKTSTSIQNRAHQIADFSDEYQNFVNGETENRITNLTVEFF